MSCQFFVKLMFAAVFALAYVNTGWCDDKKPQPHWYMLQVQTGNTTYQCFGTSPLGEKEMAQHLAVGSEYVALDDLVYRDNEGRIKTWQEWDPVMGSRLYVNPKFVILLQPLEGDPRKSASPAKKAK